MSTEWLVQPKRRCQTWLYLLSYLRYKWRNNEETGFISDKTSNPWAIHVEKSIDEFERGLTPLAPDKWESAPSTGIFPPLSLSTSQSESTPPTCGLRKPLARSGQRKVISWQR